MLEVYMDGNSGAFQWFEGTAELMPKKIKGEVYVTEDVIFIHPQLPETQIMKLLLLYLWLPAMNVKSV